MSKKITIKEDLNEFLLYTAPDGEIKVEVLFNDETIWLTQKKMAELFGVDVRTISEHLTNIYESQELQRDPTIRKFRIVQNEGGRDVEREIDFYNLDAIIAVGYRVNSSRATQFRIWATERLKEYITLKVGSGKRYRVNGKSRSDSVYLGNMNNEVNYYLDNWGLIK